MAKDYYNLNVTASVEIFVNDEAPDDAISRALTEEWQRHMYRFRDLDEVLEHLAYNCLFNGVRDASRLDGWADLEPGMVTMRAEQ